MGFLSLCLLSKRDLCAPGMSSQQPRANCRVLENPSKALRIFLLPMRFQTSDVERDWPSRAPSATAVETEHRSGDTLFRPQPVITALTANWHDIWGNLNNFLMENKGNPNPPVPNW